MRMYAVRNVDGQVGIVAAQSRVDAVERLDEFANFEGCPIRELPDMMLLLDIDDEGELAVAQLGEELECLIREFAYPLVQKVLNSRTQVSTALMRKAVEAERKRVGRKTTAQPLTERGREVTERLDLPASLVRKQERRVARAILERTKAVNDPKKRH